ncbi:MAG: sugar phosphate nucleotidyltransferase, partial [Thermodesulfovibrionales bacterium]|nr:sugar phosphate nucleotidyltransferase [Thermodesulfovibrionales bacterium]
MNLSAFILAAGLGERLRPITDHIPKPLLPILGKPILQSVLEKVIALPINNIGMNLHHKKDIIKFWIGQYSLTNNITLFIEDPILGTGGALKNAEVFLKNGPFLVHNSDILSDIDLEKLIECHVSSGNLATLAVHDYPQFNGLILDKNGFLKDIVKHPHPYPPPSPHSGGFAEAKRGREVEENAPPSIGRQPSGILSWSNNLPLNSSPSSGGRGLGGVGIESKKFVAFTGIAVYQPEFLHFLPPGNSSVVDAWFRALSAGYRIGTMDVSGCYWTDIGTPASYAKAVIHELRKNGENVYIHQSVKGCMHAELDGYVVIEKDNVLNKGVTLRNCISLPGTMIGKTSTDESSPECFLTLFWGTRGDATEKKVFEHCILGPDFIVKLSESDLYTTDNH